MDVLRKNQIIQVEIQDIAYGGIGIAKLESKQGDFIVFIENTIPGQKIEARLIKIKKRYAEAKLVRVLERSKDEISLPYQRIPGAPFAQWPIEKQIEAKQKSTLEMFKRIALEPQIEEKFDEYISSPQIWEYRNKMEYSFSSLESDLETAEEKWGFALGFKRRGQWWAVENLEKSSGLFDHDFENLLPKLRSFFEQTKLSAWNPAESSGFYRFLVLRKSYFDNELLLNLVTSSEGLDQFPREKFIQILLENLGEKIAGIWITINDDKGDAAKQPSENATLIYGKAKIREKILGLDFDISMQSFFQTNPKSAEKLYSKAISYVEAFMSNQTKGNGIAMDLFCGTGTIAQLLSKSNQIQQVVGVDIVKEAIDDAKMNAEKNSNTKLQFYCADVGKFLVEHPQYKNKIDLIVLDPPRAGIVPKALVRTIELGAKAIIYISCNPSTQARDSLVLKEHGYELKKYALVDQFPHTAHIESIGWFEKKV